MRNSILVRSIAAVSGIVMLASVAACGDNTTASTDFSASLIPRPATVSGTSPALALLPSRPPSKL